MAKMYNGKLGKLDKLEELEEVIDLTKGGVKNNGNTVSREPSKDSSNGLGAMDALAQRNKTFLETKKKIHFDAKYDAKKFDSEISKLKSMGYIFAGSKEVGDDIEITVKNGKITKTFTVSKNNRGIIRLLNEYGWMSVDKDK